MFGDGNCGEDNMLKSHIEFENGKPFISVNGELHSPLAYTTYFDECGEFSDFIKAGYKIFFVNVSFTDLPISNTSGFTPFRTGVFEKDEPDYSEFDGVVRGIVSQCPDALIFPRINISMPWKWIEENINETIATAKGGNRESFYSDSFLRDGAELLKVLVSHIRSADYSGRIAGFQLCGGTTQEWFHHDLFGSFSPFALEKFREWMLGKYGVENASLPDKKDLESGALTEEVQKYAEFCCEAMAKTAEHFARTLKEYIKNQQIVGIFYGYNAFVSDYLWGTHGMRHIIDSPYIDFFSSPCAYDDNRNSGLDWGDMIPVDSIKNHNKLAFIECDIRTHLTKRMQDSRPGEYPDDILLLRDSNGNKTVWSGPDTLELSLSAIRKAFAHQLTKGSGIWWFDMWGGWYHDPKIMAELEKMNQIADFSMNKKSEVYPSAEAVLFIDERAYANIPRGNPLLAAVGTTRVAMGNTGIPFDLCMVEDAPEVIHKYRTAIFTAPIPTQCGIKAVELCEKYNISVIKASEEKPYFTTNELRELLVSSGVHCYNNKNNVVNVGGGYLGVHSVADGEINIKLPKKYKVKSLLGIDLPECKTDNISFNMKKHDTAVFELI